METVEGYVLADKPIPFQITEDGKKVEVTATNKPIINDLKFGNYYFKEVETVEGYVLADKPIPFQITEDGKKVEVTATNKPITGKVEITKTDVSTGESLPNTGIKIYMEDKKTVVFEGRTDSNGKVTFGPLE